MTKPFLLSQACSFGAPGRWCIQHPGSCQGASSHSLVYWCARWCNSAHFQDTILLSHGTVLCSKQTSSSKNCCLTSYFGLRFTGLHPLPTPSRPTLLRFGDIGLATLSHTSLTCPTLWRSSTRTFTRTAQRSSRWPAAHAAWCPWLI